MTSRFAEDDAANPDGPLNPASDNPGAEPVAAAGDAGLWSEPAAPTQRVLTELFRSGGKTAPEVQDLLGAEVDSVGWLDYWARAGFLREMVRGAEKRFELSKRGMLELELDVT